MGQTLNKDWEEERKRDRGIEREREEIERKQHLEGKKNWRTTVVDWCLLRVSDHMMIVGKGREGMATRVVRYCRSFDDDAYIPYSRNPSTV